VGRLGLGASRARGRTAGSNWHYYIARDGKEPYRDAVDSHSRYASDIRLPARLGRDARPYPGHPEAGESLKRPCMLWVQK
jgi:hypothetical protein